MTAQNNMEANVRGSPCLEEERDTWDRESPPIYDESPLAPNLGPELCATSSTQNCELIVDEAPPLIRQHLASPYKDSEPQENNAGRLKPGISSRIADVAAFATWSKTVSSLGSWTVLVFGLLSLVTGVGLGAILISKSGSNSLARPSYESIAAVASSQSLPAASV